MENIRIMPTNDGLYIDAVIVKGTKRTFTVSIETLNKDGVTFDPYDLNSNNIRFTVLGSATADGEVLLQKIITQNTDVNEEGVINYPDLGGFSFTITAEDTSKLGLGDFPIMLEILDAETQVVEYVLTEGAYKAEFNKIQIVQV